jgi:hypothetical protein
MRIFKYKDKLVEEVGTTTNEKVIYFKYLKDEDKQKCPHCCKPLDTELNIVENCLNYLSEVKLVDTVDLISKKSSQA